MIIRAKTPPNEYQKKLKQPYEFSVLGLAGFTVHEHYFCEGQGYSSYSVLGKEHCYDEWLESFRNPWWKRIFGAPLYSIETVETPEPSIYEGEE